MQIKQLVDAINDIHVTLNEAEAAGGKEQAKLLRKAAITACRTFTQAVNDGDLRADSAIFGGQPREVYERARELLTNRDSLANLVTAEVELLTRLGVDPGVVERVKGGLWEVEPPQASNSSFLRNVASLKKVICDLRDRLLRDAKYERDTRRIWGAVMSLTGIVLVGASAPLIPLMPPVGVAIGAGGVALVGKGLNMAVSDE